MKGVLEGLGLAVRAEQPCLDRRVGGDAGNLVSLAEVRRRIGRVRRALRHQYIDLVLENRLGRGFRRAGRGAL